MSNAKTARTEARDTSTGKFCKNPCNCCSKGAPMVDYFSWDHCNDFGLGVVLCKRCAVKLCKLTKEEGLAILECVTFPVPVDGVAR